ncbi:serine aminopeptidase S33 family [Thermosporothrix hazakensis]|jgi:pimeloyl-ACP methyl ester carboxylesterase|uniref:Serine aminopeptidase S33 family n=1 Tax=Thermosporothrix hazakensis TaxID=644383 RepID=A0A326TU99_THEHA|nr:alpha/beta fold hydrolase [Thermosporothrix hazakensis]PZW19500.1 serine aminopeptidase S33 family [Thermosporothrix hazakensis]GCE51424.1 alpha/beta hydrolase [Thermosporothrix hazakensis]
MKQLYREERLMLEAEGYRLPAVLALPQGGEVKWRIVLLPGSMANDVDGNYPGTPMKPHLYADLARQLAEKGHAVLRYAKYGAGTGAEIVDEQRVGAHPLFARQRYIAEAAIRKLREMVPRAKGLAVAGHSEGSVHGMMVAQQAELGVDAFISLSGPALRYMDLFIHKAQEMAKEQGEIIDFGAFKVNATHYIRAFELMRAGKPFTEDIKADPTMEFFVKSWDNDTPQAREGQQYMRDYDAVDPCIEITKVPCPVLVVQGGMDESGVHADNGERLYQARHAIYPATTQLAFFSDLQHFYKPVSPGTTWQEAQVMDGETDKRVGEAISVWLDGLKEERES